MDFSSHIRITASALWNWFIAQTLDALAVGILWFFGLHYIGVPWALLWAVLGAVLQYIPIFGHALTLIGPMLASAFSDKPERAIYVLLLYAAIVIVDGVVLQPYLLKRTAKVPIWASLLTPFVLWLAIPFWWAVVLAAPLLAVIYAYRIYYREEKRKREALLSADESQLQAPPNVL